MQIDIKPAIGLSSNQKPIESEFNAASTAEDVISGIDLSGKIAIVTGGYSGLGLETVRVLSAAGAKVIVPTRNLDKAHKALAGIDNVEIEVMELMEPSTIDAFANRFLSSKMPLHILVNSAGIMANPFTLDARGHESQFSTNHLGHFQLTLRLWPALRKAAGARVVAVSSRGHRYSPVMFDDIDFENRAYDPMKAYGQSKTANILFALELDELGKSEGIRAFSVHPGTIINTNLSREISPELLQKMGVVNEHGHAILDPMRQLKTVGQGASTVVWCATNPKLKAMGGVYCENNNIASILSDHTIMDPVTGADAKGNYGIMAYATDVNDAKKLWNLSEQLTNVSLK